MLKPMEAAYLAGMIDGDGTISFKNIDSIEHQNPVITISSSDLKMLVYIQSMLNGSLSSKKITITGSITYLYSLEIKMNESVYGALKQIQKLLQSHIKIQEVERVLDQYKPESRAILPPNKTPRDMLVLKKAY
ncbi:LAGLIDADG family homing endonuclease [Piscibacillus halophilus]|uniref:LAGLIDADG-like domain-containing protein n=1 Tax=Piscibacillus halophilus TaxID=571933 RepID=A0A1H9CWL2_9BACI|nr:LAGLIDADG family homing endonuclease [Piscibacillus halophilus]SEQ05626.1 LAGLIDADG-like domain-containing protein [Piscibacillus halophilus]